MLSGVWRRLTAGLTRHKVELVGLKVIGKPVLVGVALFAHTAFAASAFDLPPILQRHASIVMIPFQCLGCADNHNLSLFHKVVMAGGSGRRALTPEERRKFAATGEIKCNLGPSTAMATVQAVGAGREASKVVLTTAHELYNKDCSRRRLNDCKVYFPNSSDKKPFKINIETIEGSCPYIREGSRKGEDNYNIDFAVFELDRPVVGAIPYAVPALDDPDPYEGLPITTVSAGSHDFPQYHISEGLVRDREYFDNAPMQTQGTAGKGTSGAGQFSGESQGRPLLVSLHAGGYAKDPQSREYNRDTNFNVSVPVQGRLRQIIWDKISRTRQ